MKVSLNRHGPNRFKAYREIHETVINQFMDSGFVGFETLEFNPIPKGFLLEGEIACQGEIIITVEKFLEILSGEKDNATVQTVWYAYNASVRNRGTIFRYDNQDDDYLRPGHLDEHHKHLFDWSTGQELAGSPSWVGSNNWPTLGDVIQELEEWYWEHHSELPNPDNYPELGLRNAPPSLVVRGRSPIQPLNPSLHFSDQIV